MLGITCQTELHYGLYFSFSHTDLSLTHCTSRYLTFVERVLSTHHTHSSPWLSTEDRAGVFLSSSALFVTGRAVISISDSLLWQENPLALSSSFQLRGHFAFVPTLFHAWLLTHTQLLLVFPAVLCPAHPCWEGVQRTPRSTSCVYATREQLLSHISVYLK